MIEVKNLSIVFKKKIFDFASFICHEGEIVSIYGESGSGKTTFLKFLIGDVVGQSGQLLYYGEEINDKNRDDFLFNVISYVDQTGSYFENMTIYDHFEFYGRTHEIEMNQSIAQEYLKSVHLDYISLKKRPSQLSTGERKRFLLALALMMQKKIIIIDEPTASLDQKNIKSLMNIIQELSMKGITFIMTTHDQQIIDNSHVVYEIDKCKLMKCKNKGKENHNHEYTMKKPLRVRYSSYKNLKLRILLIVLMCVGGCALAFVSRTIASYISIERTQSTHLQDYKNKFLYLSKAIDPRYNLNQSHLVNLGSENHSTVDIISSEEIDRIKQIEGVIDIKPAYYVEKSYQNSMISVYQNGQFLKEISSYACDRYNYCYDQDVFITAYYPEENIKKNGKVIQGIYIDDMMEDILDVSSYNELQISFMARRYTGFSYGIDENQLPNLYPQYFSGKITIGIDGVLTRKEYNDGRYEGSGRIYMPIDEFRIFIDSQFKGPFDESEIPFQPRQYMIICEDGKDESVKLEIERMNDLYYALNDNITKKDFIDYVKQQNLSSLFMMTGINIVFISGLMLLIGYYVTLRSKEIPLFQKEGLLRYVRSYYRGDNIELVLGWIAISMLCLPLAFYYLESFRNSSYMSIYIGTWVAVTICLSVLVLIFKNIFHNYMIKKVTQNDKS